MTSAASASAATKSTRLGDGTVSAYCGRLCMHGKEHDNLFNANNEPMCEVGFCPNAACPLGNGKYGEACCNTHARLLDERAAAAEAEKICVSRLEPQLQRRAAMLVKAWASKQAGPQRVTRAEAASDYDAMQKNSVCFNNRVCFNDFECGKKDQPPRLRLPGDEGDEVAALKQQVRQLEAEVAGQCESWHEHFRKKEKAAQVQKDKELAIKCAEQEAAFKHEVHGIYIAKACCPALRHTQLYLRMGASYGQSKTGKTLGHGGPLFFRPRNCPARCPKTPPT